MSYNVLKQAIRTAIKQNGNNEITGAILQEILLSIVNSLGLGYQFIGVATPTVNPGTPDQNVFYLAATAGTYTNFGGIVLETNKLYCLFWAGSAWSSVSVCNLGGGGGGSANLLTIGIEYSDELDKWVYDDSERSIAELVSLLNTGNVSVQFRVNFEDNGPVYAPASWTYSINGEYIIAADVLRDVEVTFMFIENEGEYEYDISVEDIESGGNILKVTASINTSTGAVTLDKTFAEILDAHENGAFVFGYIEALGIIAPLVSIGPVGLTFSVLSSYYKGRSYGGYILMNDDDEVTMTANDYGLVVPVVSLPSTQDGYDSNAVLLLTTGTNKGHFYAWDDEDDEWVDITASGGGSGNILKVTATINASTGAVTLDTTFAEIMDAHEDGAFVFMEVPNVAIAPLSAVVSNSLYFYFLSTFYKGKYYGGYISVHEDDEVTMSVTDHGLVVPVASLPSTQSGYASNAVLLLTTGTNKGHFYAWDDEWTDITASGGGTGKDDITINLVKSGTTYNFESGFYPPTVAEKIANGDFSNVYLHPSDGATMLAKVVINSASNVDLYAEAIDYSTSGIEYDIFHVYLNSQGSSGIGHNAGTFAGGGGANNVYIAHFNLDTNLRYSVQESYSDIADAIESGKVVHGILSFSMFEGGSMQYSLEDYYPGENITFVRATLSHEYPAAERLSVHTDNSVSQSIGPAFDFVERRISIPTGTPARRDMVAIVSATGHIYSSTDTGWIDVTPANVVEKSVIRWEDESSLSLTVGRIYYLDFRIASSSNNIALSIHRNSSYHSTADQTMTFLMRFSNSVPNISYSFDAGRTYVDTSDGQYPILEANTVVEVTVRFVTLTADDAAIISFKTYK